MADFIPIFDKVILIEGGYKLHKVEGDRGGMTYAGIARNFWPKWPGWLKIDNNEIDSELTSLVKDFYKIEFWNKIHGNDINSQHVAYHIYAFAVNASKKVSIRITQQIILARPDGVFGNKTLKLLNDLVVDEKDERIFILTFSLLKVFRYKNICSHDKRRHNDSIVSNVKFLRGWINRVQLGLEQEVK